MAEQTNASFCVTHPYPTVPVNLLRWGRSREKDAVTSWDWLSGSRESCPLANRPRLNPLSPGAAATSLAFGAVASVMRNGLSHTSYANSFRKAKR